MTSFFSKQLVVGLLSGAVFAGLGFALFSGGGASDITISDSANEHLLAQIIPGEDITLTEGASGTESSSEHVIEVRSAPVPAKKITTKPVEAVADASGDVGEASLPVAEIRKCSYAEGVSKPARLGIISEVAWMGSGDDSNAEWVEMQNHSKGELDVSGWQLVDKAEQIRAIVSEDSALSKNGFLLFEREPHQLSGTTVLYKGVISNTNEGLRLFNADCVLQDEVVAGSKWPAGTNNPKRTAERGSDLTWHTYYGSGEAGILGTPGSRNSAGEPPKVVEPEPELAQASSSPAESPAPSEGATSSTDSTASSSASSSDPESPTVVPVSSGQLIISEVMAGSASGAGDEFIELYNTTDSEIDLTGFSIKKKVLSSGSESSLVTTVNFAGKKVGAGQRFLIGHGAYASESQMTWPVSYSIAYAGNAVLLYNTQGEKIDEVSWELSAGQSYACASQGSCAVQESPNPGA